MPKTLTIEDKSTLRLYSTCLAGAVASLLTQPLEVIKTNRINTPALVYSDLHKTIISKGWRAYMQGRYIAPHTAPSPWYAKPLALLSTRSSSHGLKLIFQIRSHPSTSF